MKAILEMLKLFAIMVLFIYGIFTIAYISTPTNQENSSGIEY